ncbi:MAG TPA: MMPL family transporter [Geobacteraceae bacterium]
MKRFIRIIHDLIRGHLTWLFRITWERPRTTVAISALFFALALFSLLSIRFESDIFRLFPAKSGAIRLLLDSLEWTGSASEAYFLLEGDRNTLPPAAETFAGRLRSMEIDGRPAFRKITYRVFDPQEADAFAAFLGYAAYRPQLFLDPAGVDGYLRRLEPAGMDRALARARAELASQLGMGMRGIIAADPLYLRELVLPRLQEGSRSLDLDPDSPYFLSRDGRLLIMIAEPAQPAQDMVFARKLAAGIDRARAGMNVRISCAGAHLSAVIDERVMKQNILVSIISSLAVVLGLFYFTYRRLMPTLLIPLIILYGTVMAMGTAGLFLPTIHIISFAFTALIIGLGTDYTIHLYDRFYTERSAGKEAGEALRLAVIDTGHGIFTAGVTTAVPFLALVTSSVRALSELGLLVGLGVIFSMYATFLFLPPLLVYAERSFPARMYAPLPSFGMASVWRFTAGKRRTMVLVSALIVAVSLAASLRISFEGELKNLQPRHSEAYLTQEKMEKHLFLSPKQMVVAVEGDNLDDLLTRGGKIWAAAETHRKQGELASVSWLGNILNDPATQQAVIQRLRRGLAGRAPAKDLTTLLANNGFAPQMFQETATGLAGLPEAAIISPDEAVEHLADSPLSSMVNRYLVRRNGTYHLLLYLNYRGDEFRQKAFLAELAQIDPAARATSVDLVSRQLAQTVEHSFIRGFAIGGILVVLLLIFHFRNFAGVFSSLFPVIAGVIVMLGIMASIGMRLNFMNSMVIVTILGMGSDYGLQIHNRLQGEPSTFQEGFLQSSRAVFLSALTNIVGFGSLAFTDYGAMSSIGWATNFGVCATTVFALLILPAFFRRA